MGLSKETMNTVEELLDSIATDAEPPEGLSSELAALWWTKKDRWQDAHEVAQDIDTPMGSWIHALLHTIEGDMGNAAYWYNRADRPAIGAEQIDAEWENIVSHILGEK